MVSPVVTMWMCDLALLFSRVKSYILPPHLVIRARLHMSDDHYGRSASPAPFHFLFNLFSDSMVEHDRNDERPSGIHNKEETHSLHRRCYSGDEEDK